MAHSFLVGSLKGILLAVVLSYYANKYLGFYHFPHGYPVDIPMSERPRYAKVDKTNNILQAKRKFKWRSDWKNMNMYCKLTKHYNPLFCILF